MCDPARGTVDVEGVGCPVRDEDEGGRHPAGTCPDQPTFELELRERLRGLAELEPPAGLRERVQAAIGLSRRPWAH